MIRLTPHAAEEVRKVAVRCDAHGMFLRIAARSLDGGTVTHGMGFDERREGDLLLTSEGIVILVAPRHRPLLEGTVMDFVKLGDGGGRFVYFNPNDRGCASFLAECGACAEPCRPRAPTPRGEWGRPYGMPLSAGRPPWRRDVPRSSFASANE